MPYAMRALAEAEPASKGDYATCFTCNKGACEAHGTRKASLAAGETRAE